MKISDMDQRQKHSTTWSGLSYTSIKYIHSKESNNATVQSLNREKDFSSVLIYIVDEGAPLIQYLIENIDN